MNKKNECNLIMQKGDILKALNYRKNPHLIVFLKNKDEDSFYACVLSTKKEHADNVEMQEKHFCTHKLNGEEYLRKYNKEGGSFLIKHGFEKKVIDINYSKGIVGRLTEEGIAFVEEEMKDATYQYFPKPIWDMDKTNLF